MYLITIKNQFNTDDRSFILTDSCIIAKKHIDNGHIVYRIPKEFQVKSIDLAETVTMVTKED